MAFDPHKVESAKDSEAFDARLAALMIRSTEPDYVDAQAQRSIKVLLDPLLVQFFVKGANRTPRGAFDGSPDRSREFKSTIGLECLVDALVSRVYSDHQQRISRSQARAARRQLVVLVVERINRTRLVRLVN